MDSAAKIALKSIPVVGGVLVDIYEGVDAEDQEKGVESILEVLARIESIGEAGFEEVAGKLQEVAALQSKGLAVLVGVKDEMGSLAKEVSATREDLANMDEQLDKVQSELASLAFGGGDFNPKDPGDQLRFVVVLGQSLSDSKAIFDRQLEFARELLDGLSEDDMERVRYSSANELLTLKDDLLARASYLGLIRPGRPRQIFEALRRVTDEMQTVNLRVRSLVRAAEDDLLPSRVDRAQLDTHLSLWLAKYEYMLARHSSHMCLVFVGRNPKIEFPRGTDEHVAAAIEQRLERTELDYLSKICS
ncbi:phosphopantetheine adenylyltransferase [Plesiocystis pacifica SIR-1]|uniref:Phosphopantetheine adenylyltransferase n=1 Tax=Plesiocystis pacifica SIR-1 TaxID=391625 RepID=A6G8C9_9BACT|nr:phosphopantetheine adenylyltransferase [Plesiocystis pacifica SIR-1]